MRLKEKYISNSENNKKPDAKKTILTDDAYAICELIENLTHALRMASINLKR